ncbi:MAG TPA: TadE/TadG family type IV pilus assembly protein [Pseudolabrys sp.]|nr:TadE/TadG family type IV pilus assembly protein [Pseudolabrys sp.]
MRLVMRLGRFWRDRRGSVAPMVALSMVPLLGGVGAAIDYTRASAAQAALQAAVDSTALMLSKTAATQSTSAIQSSASSYFSALFSRPDTSNAAVTASYTNNNGSQIVLTGSGTVATSIMQVFGYNQINISASSTVVWGNSRLRVALVLDNTGSMSQYGKMTALKTASQNLLTQLQSAATQDGDVYVSIVPFTKDVNVGSENYAQSWLRWDLWEAANGTCSKTKYTSQSSCTSNNGTWTPKAHSTWNGCITDRDQNYDTLNTAPTVGSTLFPAEQYSVCPVELLPLTYDWTSLSNKITAMQPAGNTNQAIGLQMGWQTLTASPYTVPTEDPNYTYKHVIILLTDGLNTQDRWYTSETSIDTRQQTTCDNIKAAGITVYTVQVNTDGDPTSTLLQNCASSTDKFFLLTSANEIVTTFNTIGTALTQLRVAR